MQLVEVVCCKMTQLQRDIYNHFLESKAAARLLGDSAAKKGGGTQILTAINALKKLCNHPKLIYDIIHGREQSSLTGFDGCAQFFPPGAACCVLRALSSPSTRGCTRTVAACGIRAGVFAGDASFILARCWFGGALR